MTTATKIRGITLSPEQERVVNHRGGHLQVIACAGAGKTELANLVGKAAQPFNLNKTGQLV